jgi:DNA-binding MarR family transcriptional regulator
MISGPVASEPSGDDPLVSLRTVQRCLATLVQRGKDIAVHERLGQRVGYPLDGPYYGTLSMIGRMGECTPTELAALLASEPSTVSRRVRALEERGLVERHVSLADRRSYRLRLTKDGSEAFEALDAGWLDTIGALFDGWSPEEVARFADQLDRFASAFETLAGNDTGRRVQATGWR